MGYKLTHVVSSSDTVDLGSKFRKAIDSNNPLEILLSLEGQSMEDISRPNLSLQGVTLLLHAIHQNSQTAVEVLLSKHVDVNVGDANGRTPLHWAALRGDLDLTAAILRAEASINMCDSYNHTPLCYAVYHRNCAVAQCLLDSGADINCRSTLGGTMLHMAVREDNSEMVKVLLDNKADPHFAGDEEVTPMELAMAQKSFEIVNMLNEHIQREKQHT